MEGKCVCQVRCSKMKMKMKMKPHWKGEEISRLKEKYVEQPFVYRQSDIFKMRFLLNCLGSDWLPLSREQSKRDHGRNIRMRIAYSFSSDSHIKGGKKTRKQHPPPPHHSEWSWKIINKMKTREKKTTTFFLLSHTFGGAGARSRKLSHLVRFNLLP